ncbi:MAG: hypothetical protein WCC57_06645 [Paracoccaceae bacterium]
MSGAKIGAWASYLGGTLRWGCWLCKSLRTSIDVSLGSTLGESVCLGARALV